MDLQGTKFLSVNEAMCDILGYSREELLSTKPTDLMDQESRLLFKERIRKKQAGEKIDETIEYRIRRKDGEWIDTAINVGAITYTDEKPGRVVVIGYDITERKKIEQALRQSEERYRHLVQHAPAGIYEIDFPTGRFTEVNDVMCQILGYTRDELLAMTAFNILDDKGKALFAARIRLGRSGGRPNEAAEYLVRTKDGRLIWALLNITFRWDGDKIIGATVVAHDITERKRAEKALRENQTLLNAIMESTPDPVYVKDDQSRIVMANPALAKVVGKPLEKILGRTDTEYYGDLATGQALREHDLQVMKLGQGEVMEETVPTPHGYRTFLSSKAPYRNASGDIIGITGISRDITERKRIEEQLRQAEEKSRLLIKYAPSMLYEIDFHQPAFKSVNDAMCQFLGYTREELLAMSPFDLLDDEGKAIFRERIRRKLAGETISDSVEYKSKTKDGREVYGVLNMTFTYKDGNPEGAVVVGHDITERKQAEEALRKAYEELEKRVQERTSELSEAVERLRVENIQRKRLEDTLRESEKQVRFFASQCLTAQETERKRVAGELHDSIATALAAMKIRIEKVTEEMQQGHGSPESLQDLSSKVTEVNNEVRRIMADLRPSILDDLGIIAAMNWFCREYQKTYSHISVEKQIDLPENDVSDSLKTAIFRVSQEAMNNIAKHSQASHVSLSLQERNSGIELTIQDNGQGFDLGTVRRGLGLSTMRERAQLSGGSFDLESAIGKGTLIRVSWPL